jgi:hypothetical protein
MLYREIIAVSSEIHTKYINTLCGQKEFWLLNLVVPLGLRGFMTHESPYHCLLVSRKLCLTSVCV